MAFDFPSATNKNYLQTINPNAPDAGAALKVLSLNLPNFLGGSPIAPDGLLRPGLSTNAQVGGTPDTAPPPVAAPSAALAGLSAQLGTPDQAPATAAPDSGGTPLASASAPSSPTAQAQPSPFPTTTAPIAQLMGSIMGSTPTPSTPAPPSPNVEFGAPDHTPTDIAQLLLNLFQGPSTSGGQYSVDNSAPSVENQMI